VRSLVWALRSGRVTAAVVFGAVAVSLVPWIAYLSVSLPTEHVATNWTLVWTGFDIGLALLAIATATAVWRSSNATVLLATALATMLVCDAWFDVTTSQPGNERLVAILMAGLLELPAAAYALHVALRAERTH
jgi:hypothetical protein